MTDSAAILAALARLEQKVDELRRSPPKLLSRRAAARLLGVDRGSTLESLIRQGRLRLVAGRIPLAEIERLLADGVPARARRPRSAETPDQAEAIRALRP